MVKNNEIRNKKIINGIIGFILFFVILFGGFWLIDNRYTIELKAQENEINLASPELTDKEYLGYGVYKLYNENGITIDYDVFSGIYEINGTVISGFNYYVFDIEQYTEYTISHIAVSGILEDGFFRLVYTSPYTEMIRQTNENINKQTTFTTTTQHRLGFSFETNTTFTNYQFKLQLEKGTEATPYQLPLAPIQQHEQFIYDDGYDLGLEHGYDYGYDLGLEHGYDYGVDDGYIDGFDDGLMSVLQVRDYLGYSNLDNIIFLERNQIGPNDRFFGFKIENVDTYIENLTFFSTMLTNSDYFSPLNELSSGSRAGITLNYSDSDFIFYSFADMANVDDEYNFHNINKEKKVEYITVRFLLRANLPSFDFPSFQQSLFQNISLFINDQYFNDLFIKRISDIYYNNGLKDGVSQGYDYGYDDGYDDGLYETDATGFGALLTTVFTGLGGLLAIELLPNIHIGAIIAVPLVFGIIFFILGKRKGD